MVKYRYDAWGNCKVLNASGTEITDANHIGNLNPFRYRFYYYDTETKLYFLQSRYYDPEVGRFITIDDISYLDPDSINGLNLYAYCGNNPIMNIDPTGSEWWTGFISGFVTGIQIAAGIVLCGVPGAQALGIGLIISASLTVSVSIMDAAGVDPKVTSCIESGLSIVIGFICLFVPVPGFRPFGATMIGSGIGGFIGGAISEYYDWNYSFGAAIGQFLGGIAGGAICKGLQRIEKVGVYVKLDDLHSNKLDDFVKCAPNDRAISHWTTILAENPGAYNTARNLDGEVEVIKVIINSGNTLSNGHHRVYVMKNIINNAHKYIKVFLTK